MIRVQSTWARRARAMAVPGCPEFAFCGASMARPLMTLMPSCSSSASGIGPPLCRLPLCRLRTLPAVDSGAKQHHRCREAVEEVATADGPQLAGAEHAGHGSGFETPGDDARVVVGSPEHSGAPPVAREQQGGVGPATPDELAKVLVGG